MYTKTTIKPNSAQFPILYVNLHFPATPRQPQNRDLSAFPFNSAASASKLKQAGLPQPAAALILAAPSRPASGAGATGAAVVSTSSTSSAAPPRPRRHHERQLIQLYFIATKHSAADKCNSGNQQTDGQRQTRSPTAHRPKPQGQRQPDSHRKEIHRLIFHYSALSRASGRSPSSRANAKPKTGYAGAADP